MTVRAEYLVVDTGGFIKNDLGGLHSMADHVVTLHEVVSELRDKDVRQRLRNTPLEMSYRTPTTEAIRKVSDFARKTGDFASLSAVDVSVIAVAYDLEVANVGSSHLKTVPTIKKTTEFYHPKDNKEKSDLSDAKLPGFFQGEESSIPETKSEGFDQFNFWREPLPDLDIEEEMNSLNLSSSNISRETLTNLNNLLLKKPFIVGYEVSPVDFAVFSLIEQSEIDEDVHENLARWVKNVKTYDEITTEDVDINKVLELIKNSENFTLEDVVSGDYDSNAEESNDDHGYDSDIENEDEDEDDDEGWITPSNLKAKKAVITGVDESILPKKVAVALMTTDFAMQNVCKQMGLNLIGTNGLMIKETKTWILRCYGCFRTTPLMDKKFCPKCGNKTLKRVSVTLNADGSQQIHISTRRPINTKGKKFSLPAPKGGKHAWNPRLSEDQPEPQQRLSRKAMARTNPMGEDYLVGGSPFVTHDVTSKSAMLGLAGGSKGNAAPPGFYWSRKNPNSVRKNTGNRKK